MNASAWVGSGAAALAVVLLLPPRARLGLDRVGDERADAVPPAGRVVAATLAVGAVVTLAGGGALLVPALLVGAAAGAGALGWRRHRQRARELCTAAAIRECCEQLAAELSAGRPAAAALDALTPLWPPLRAVAEAQRVGADVPAALRAQAARPGARDLRLVAAAWQVAHRTGQGLADAVDRVAVGLRAAEATRRVVGGELASARSTARLVTGLPLLALAMGSGAGGDPVAFLLGGPAGWACLAGGLGLAGAGLWWIEALARDVERG